MEDAWISSRGLLYYLPMSSVVPIPRGRMLSAIPRRPLAAVASLALLACALLFSGFMAPWIESARQPAVDSWASTESSDAQSPIAELPTGNSESPVDAVSIVLVQEAALDKVSTAESSPDPNENSSLGLIAYTVPTALPADTPEPTVTSTASHSPAPTATASVVPSTQVPPTQTPPAAANESAMPLATSTVTAVTTAETATTGSSANAAQKGLPALATPTIASLTTAETATASPSITPASSGVGPSATLTSTPVAVLGAATQVPPRPTSAAKRSGAGAPVLMYHYIRVNPVASDQLGFGLSVTPNDFAAQMALLADSGYRTVSVPDVFNAAHGQNREKVIAITFDDGYADAYTAAYPILKARGMIATFYVISDFVGRPGYLNADQIREMAASGMIIGSHSVSHPDLSQIINPALQQQLSASRRALEEMVGLPVLDLCYPSGRYNEGVLVAARNAGYRTAVTTRYGLVVPGQSPLELFRIRVSGGQGAAGLAAALGDR